jgi:hypothetical protein
VNIQPYFKAYLKHHPKATVDNFSSADYIIWITRQHSKFRREMGLPDYQPYNKEQKQEFINFINKMESSADQSI